MMKRILPLLLCTLTLLCFASCDGSQGNTPDTTAAPQTEAQPQFFEMSAEVVIVRADESTEAMDAMKALQAALLELYGYEIPFRTDFLMKDEKPFAFEILVGATNREIAASFYSGLTYRDYGYEILSPSTVVIAGGSADATVRAVEKFLADVYGYTGEGTGKAAALPVGTAHMEKHTYPVTALTLAGNPLSDYTVTYELGTDFRDAAAALVDSIESMTGIRLPMQSKTATLTTAHSINIGSPSGSVSEYKYTFSAKDGNFSIASSQETASGAVGNFLSRYLPATASGKVDIAAPEKAVEGYAFNAIQTMDLVLQKTTDETKVCAGVKRYTRHYVDRDGNPSKVYIIECAPGSVSPVLGTKNAELSITGTQQILDQIAAEEAKYGVDVCAAVNGCLYSYENGAYAPFGMCIKDGTIVTDLQREGYAIFAVMKDGSYFFGYPTAANVKVSDIQQCVSGAYMLIEDGELVDMAIKSHDPDFGTIRHPRTAVGMKEDGTLFFVVVDGRQSGFSLGATLPDLALIFKDLGCVQAVNIDGGGSSISYTKDYATGEYIQWNSPSGGAPRAVITCTLLVRNPEYREDT